MRIAVLDACPIQTDFICWTLGAVGHACFPFANVGELATELRRQTFDLLVLEWNMSYMTGDHALHWFRQSHSARLPVLLMANRSDETDIAAMLNSGADDYVVKPVSEQLLVSRVDSLLRRECQPLPPALEQTFGTYKFDLELQQASVRGRTVALTQKEFDLALLLSQHLNRPLSRVHILDAIWKQSNYNPSRTMDTHMSKLRSKLELRPENGYRLTPLYGYGYRLDQVDGDDA
ncbi:response regulator transcription factor [Paraburkholderia sp. JHI869]|uniref:response regulator transcription factor n=1 Tax=Paraburkholderia sp. JHI869 TaxID=3112959 RepID=UPI003172D17C